MEETDKKANELIHSDYEINAIFNYRKLQSGAEIPYKLEGRDSDVGYKLTIISRCDGREEDNTNDINTFRTGLAFNFPPNYHGEVVVDGDIVNQGYMIAQCPLIINRRDDGELIIPLLKFKECDDLQLPITVGTLVLRKTVHMYQRVMKEIPNMAQQSYMSSDIPKYFKPTSEQDSGFPQYHPTGSKPTQSNKKGGSSGRQKQIF